MNQKVTKLAVIAAVSASAFLAGCGKSIAPAEYCGVSFSGVNGSATAEVEFDDNFYLDAFDSLSDKKQKELVTECGGSSDFAKLGLAYAIQLKGEFDKDSELSNGDVITLQLSWDEESVKKYGLKLGGDKEVQYTVEGLQDAIVLDAFDSAYFNVPEGQEGVHMRVTGVSPHLTVELVNECSSENPLHYLQYTVHGGMDCANGDTLTVTVSSSLLPQDYKLESEECSLEVNGYNEYVTSFDSVSVEGLDYLKSELLKMRDEKISVGKAGNLVSFEFEAPGDRFYFTQGDFGTIEDVRYSNVYFLTPKDESGDKKGILVAEFEMTVRNWTNSLFSAAPFDVDPAYGCVPVKDLVVMGENSTETPYVSLDAERRLYASEEEWYASLEEAYGAEYEITPIDFKVQE